MKYWINVWSTPSYPGCPWALERHESEHEAFKEVADMLDGQLYEGYYYVHTIVVDGDTAGVEHYEKDALQEVLRRREERRSEARLQSYVRSQQ